MKFQSNESNSLSPPQENDKQKSPAWNYFIKKEDYGYCQIQGCKKIISAKGTTTGLLNHLIQVHKIDFPKNSNNLRNEDQVNQEAGLKHRKIFKYLKIFIPILES